MVLNGSGHQTLPFNPSAKSRKGENKMNVSVLIGNLGGDPESAFTNEGTQVVTFSLAFRSGKDKTSWIQVKCWNKMAEVAETYLHKGAKIAVTGMLVQNKWTTDDGQNRSIHQIFANSIDFIKTDGRGFENGESQPDEETPF
jgi:single-strand DNA-binding protein